MRWRRDHLVDRAFRCGLSAARRDPRTTARAVTGGARLSACLARTDSGPSTVRSPHERAAVTVGSDAALSADPPATVEPQPLSLLDDGIARLAALPPRRGQDKDEAVGVSCPASRAARFSARGRPILTTAAATTATTSPPAAADASSASGSARRLSRRSRFTTWGYKFALPAAVKHGSVVARGGRCPSSANLILSELVDRHRGGGRVSSSRRFNARSRCPTPHQRRVLVELALNGVADRRLSDA